MSSKWRFVTSLLIPRLNRPDLHGEIGMSKIALVVFLLPIMLIQCSPHHARTADTIAAAGATVDFKTLFDICDTAGFEQGAHETIPIYKPFIVREVKGKLNWRGGWPEGYLPLFAIRPTGKGTQILSVSSDSDGNFIMKDIPNGRYCFYASCGIEWKAYTGILIVDKRADLKSQIYIEMDID